MPSLTERLGGDGLTSAAPLGGAVGIHSYDSSTGTFRLVVEHGEECSPAGIMNGPGVDGARHVGNVQVFDDDQTVVINELAADFVVEVGSLVTNMGEGLLQCPDRLPTTIAAATPPTDFALCSPDLRGCGSFVSGVGDLSTIAQGGECGESDINPNGIGRRFKREADDLSKEQGVPLAGFPFDRDGFDDAFERAVPLDLQLPDSLQVEAPGWTQGASVIPLRESQRVVSPMTTKAWIPCLLVGFYTAKEAPEGSVNPSKYIGGNGEVDDAQTAVCSNQFELTVLIVKANCYSIGLPGLSSFLQCSIVESACLIDMLMKGLILYTTGVNAVPINALHVANYTMNGAGGAGDDD